jgi:hypothetical protein
VTVTVDVTEGQPVEFYCRFHSGSGMQGAFYTKAAAGASTKTGSGGSSGSSEGGGNPYGY